MAALASRGNIESESNSLYFPNFREELVHGFILVYSTRRKASIATLRYIQRVTKTFRKCSYFQCIFYEHS